MGKLESIVKCWAWMELFLTTLQTSILIFAVLVASDQTQRQLYYLTDGYSLQTKFLFLITWLIFACFILSAIYKKRRDYLGVLLLITLVSTLRFVGEFLLAWKRATSFEYFSAGITVIGKIVLIILAGAYCSTLANKTYANTNVDRSSSKYAFPKEKMRNAIEAALRFRNKKGDEAALVSPKRARKGR